MSKLRNLLQQQKQELLRAVEKIDHDLKLIEELDRVAGEYGFKVVGDGEPTSAVKMMADLTRRLSRRPVKGRKQESKRAKLIRLSIEYLKSTGKRTTSGELARIIEAQGIAIGPKPGKYLSALLTQSKLLDNCPDLGGYGLVEWQKVPPETSELNLSRH